MLKSKPKILLKQPRQQPPAPGTLRKHPNIPKFTAQFYLELLSHNKTRTDLKFMWQKDHFRTTGITSTFPDP